MSNTDENDVIFGRYSGGPDFDNFFDAAPATEAELVDEAEDEEVVGADGDDISAGDDAEVADIAAGVILDVADIMAGEGEFSIGVLARNPHAVASALITRQMAGRAKSAAAARATAAGTRAIASGKRAQLRRHPRARTIGAKAVSAGTVAMAKAKLTAAPSKKATKPVTAARAGTRVRGETAHLWTAEQIEEQQNAAADFAAMAAEAADLATAMDDAYAVASPGAQQQGEALFAQLSDLNESWSREMLFTPLVGQINAWIASVGTGAAPAPSGGAPVPSGGGYPSGSGGGYGYPSGGGGYSDEGASQWAATQAFRAGRDPFEEEEAYEEAPAEEEYAEAEQEEAAEEEDDLDAAVRRRAEAAELAQQLDDEVMGAGAIDILDDEPTNRSPAAAHRGSGYLDSLPLGGSIAGREGGEVEGEIETIAIGSEFGSRAMKSRRAARRG